MPKNMHDINAVSYTMRYPNTFSTMTCSRNCPKIKVSLLPIQNPQDRPNIAGRVLHIKLQPLMELFVDEQIFGEVIVYIGVIEFQRKGLLSRNIVKY